MKDCFSLPGLGWKYFNSLRTEDDEPICTYNDKYKGWFVRQSIKGGRVCSFNQNYKSKVCDYIFKIIESKGWTTNRLTSLSGGKILTLTDMHGHGLIMEVL